MEIWLTGWLPEQRWFADKSRAIVGVGVVTSRAIDDDVRLDIVRVDFQDGGSVDYAVPWRRDGSTYVEAIETPTFLGWLGAMLSGTTSWEPTVRRRQLAATASDLTALRARPLGVEQSNTSLRYGTEWVVKLNRRLAYGPSPELELATVLNRWTGPRCSPRTVSALDVHTDRGSASLAIQAELIENAGDGWTTLLRCLREEVAAGTLETETGRSLVEVRSIATLTADLHSALTLDPWTTDLSPERVTQDMTSGWETAARGSLEAMITLLTSSQGRLSGRASDLATIVSASVTLLRQQLGGFQALVGSTRTRVHGDYHLGQVLRTPDGPYVAIDLDGEPQRSLEERRAKYSPLRDVAGMLRSISYAVGTVRAEGQELVEDAALPTWERAARAALLETYLARLAENRTDLLPHEPDRLRQALTALELEKAIYEVAFELNNRPEWVWIPLGQLVKLG